MMIAFLRDFIRVNTLHPIDRPVDAEYVPLREELRLAGLDEEKLRHMDPDERVAALEQAQLDPYDYIYLAC